MKKLWSLIGVAGFWLSWPGLWWRLHGTRRTRVIASYDNQLLLVKGWLGSGEWLLPGGGLHKGEDPRAGAIRETAEETGLQLKEDQLEYLGEKKVSEYGIGFTAIIYRVQLTDKTVTKPQRFEITEVRWIPANQLSRLSPATRQILEG